MIACLKYRWYLSSEEPWANIRVCLCVLSCLLVLQPARENQEIRLSFVCNKDEIRACVCECVHLLQCRGLSVSMVTRSDTPPNQT